MKEKTTDDLKRELMNAADIDAYIKENQAFLWTRRSSNCWESCTSASPSPRPLWPSRRG